MNMVPNQQYYGSEMMPPPRFTVRDLLRILFRRKWIMLVCFVTVVSAVYIASQHMKPLYRSEATMKISHLQRSGNPVIDQFVQLPPAMQLATMRELLHSRSVLERLARRHGLDSEILSRAPHLTSQQATNQAVGMLMGGRLNVRVDASNIIRVAVIWEDPVRCQQLANTMCEVFIDYMFEDRKREAESARSWIQEELTKAENRLKRAENELEQFKTENSMTAVGAKGAALQAEIKRFRDARRAIEVELSDLDQRIIIVQRKLDEMQKIDPEMGEHSEEAQLVRTEIFNLRSQRDALHKHYRDNHPSILRLEQQIAAKAKSLEHIIATYKPAMGIRQQEEYQALFRMLREADVERAGLHKRMEEIDADIARVDKELAVLPSKELEFRRMARDFQSAETIHHALQSNLESTERTLQLTRQETAPIAVLDTAMIPVYPFYPNTQKNYLLGIIGGLAFALVVAFLLEFLNHSLESSEDVHQHIGLPVLGTVPVLTLK